MDSNVSAITDTIPDAALQILSHSYALYRVEATTFSKIQAANRTAVEFFNDTSNENSQGLSSCDKSKNEDKKDFLEKYRRVKNGNLYGYNIPLQSKELFRTWLSYDDKESNSDGEETDFASFRCQQPWPSDTFCTASFHLANDLHRLLLECLQQLLILDKDDCKNKNIRSKEIQSVDKDGTSQTQTRRQERNPPPPARKRFRGFSGIALESYDLKSYATNSTNNKRHCDKKHSSGFPSSFRPTNCPLDYFFYHNLFPNAINCSEHIDRGALVVVCLTDVPGLEVYSSQSSFWCPETLVHNTNLYRERTNDSCFPGLVCIMAGDQLSKLLSPTKASYACVHRVRNPLLRARLSISYELRLEL